jgi:hypothetical protein
MIRRDVPDDPPVRWRDAAVVALLAVVLGFLAGS